MEETRILLADDHRIFLEGLKNLLEEHFEIIGMAENGRDLIEKVHQHRPDIVVTDISMPELNGIEATVQIKKIDPDVKVILLTMHGDVTYATRGFEVGASAYVMKQAAADELFSAIREAIRGRTFVTPMIAGDLIKSYRDGRGIRPGDIHAKLTPRQREVLQLLAEGFSSKEVADKLNISARTVEFHKYKMMEELNLGTSAELIHYAIKHGIISI
ncbi:MAG: response regulator [Candidatus Latescibacteria bacterium]|nr:response regulator [bacterium]MBD3423042.1 response regulator [Candidatus Latescibacterota bacterium]